MAYCRLTPDSDVYVYHTIYDNYAIHVANVDENNKLLKLKYHGKSFSEKTAQKCIDRLLELRKIGYKVPQYAIKRLYKDIYIEKATLSDPGGVYCSFCKKKNDFADDVGWWCANAKGINGPCCESCWEGEIGREHIRKHGRGER